LARFHVSAQPTYGLEEILERLRQARFVPLGESSEERERFGFVTCEHMLDTQFALESCAVDPYVAFSLRRDRKAVPAMLVRAHVKMEQQAHRAATGKPLPPRERRELREEITEKLMEKVLPATQTVPLLWNLRKKQLFVGTLGKGMLEMAKPMFEDAFGLELTRLGPDGIAFTHLGAEGYEMLADLTPTHLEDTSSLHAAPVRSLEPAGAAA
jgi:DNA recombination-dependent growth factor C